MTSNRIVQVTTALLLTLGIGCSGDPITAPGDTGTEDADLGDSTLDDVADTADDTDSTSDTTGDADLDATSDTPDDVEADTALDVDDDPLVDVEADSTEPDVDLDVVNDATSDAVSDVAMDVVDDIVPDVETDSGPDVDPPFECAVAAPTCGPVEATTTQHHLVDIEGCAFVLERTGSVTSARGIFTEIASDAGGFRDIGNVLGALNRAATAGIGSKNAARLRNHPYQGFRWNSGDAATSDWYPQGITGTSDHSDAGEYDGRDVLMVSWYDHRDVSPAKGVRISVADITDIDNVDYRHMLLVTPTRDGDGDATYGPVLTGSGGALHAGGIVWVGDLLYVADTTQGFRVFDLSRIIEANRFDTDIIGVNGSNIDAHGYRYIVPQIARYQLADDSCSVRFSFAGLDRSTSPVTMVSGEYRSGDHNGRIVSWPVDDDGWLQTTDDVVYGVNAAVSGQTRMQGALTWEGNTYISSSSQYEEYGRLYRTRAGRESSISAWVYGAEDLYYDVETDRIWTAAEHPDERDNVSILRLSP